MAWGRSHGSGVGIVADGRGLAQRGPPRGTAVRAKTEVSHPELSTPARAWVWGCRVHFLGSLHLAGTPAGAWVPDHP